MTPSGKEEKYHFCTGFLSHTAVFITYCSLAPIKARVLNDHFLHEISQWKYFKHVQCNLDDLYRMFRCSARTQDQAK